MRSGSTTSYAVALAAAACLVLSGCTDGDAEEPTASPSASGSASSAGSASPSRSASGSASASPSATASVTIPAAARAHTEAGAIEFAKFYMLEADKAYVSLDPSTLKSLAGPSCEGCESAISGVAEFKSAGERQVRPSMTVAATNPLPNSTRDVAQIQVQIQAAEVDIVNAKGAVVGSTESGATVYRLAVRWTGDGWRTADLGLEQ